MRLPRIWNVDPPGICLGTIFIDRGGGGVVVVAVGTLNMGVVFLSAWLLPVLEMDWTPSIRET